MSATDENLRYLTFSLDESVFTYELTRPVEVQPGDIVGISKGVLCRSSDNFDNILSLNISWSNSTDISYRGFYGGTRFFLESPFRATENDLVPFIMPVFGKCNDSLVLEIPVEEGIHMEAFSMKLLTIHTQELNNFQWDIIMYCWRSPVNMYHIICHFKTFAKINS